MDIQAIPTWNISDQPVVGIDDGRSDENYFKSVAIDIPPIDGNQELKQGVIVFGPTQVAARSRAKVICEAMNNRINGWHSIEDLELYQTVFLAVITEGKKNIVIGCKILGSDQPNAVDFVFNSNSVTENNPENKVVGWLPLTYLPTIIDPDEAKEQQQKSVAWTW